MIKLLIGGSPCTHWSIAQRKNRETKAEGEGWELFLNYVIAKEKFKPDFFLYENNWSASKEIKEQIQKELGCELMRINSSLVSAQNRDRFYVFNWEVEQPENRGILLKDILETGEDLLSNDKSYCLTESYNRVIPLNTIERSQRSMVAKPINCDVEALSNDYYHGDSDNQLFGKIECKNTSNNGGQPAQGTRIYNTNCKSICLDADSRKYIVDNFDARGYIKGLNKKIVPVYKVKDGMITIKDKIYPIKLNDGYYIIRKLTPVECERLQTMPDGYSAAVSNTQRYKCLGNGWTADVIIHILQGILKDVPKNEKIVVLSMYDGIGTGRYCLDKMGFTNIE